jgi:hypothetical protein
MAHLMLKDIALDMQLLKNPPPFKMARGLSQWQTSDFE